MWRLLRRIAFISQILKQQRRDRESAHCARGGEASLAFSESREKFISSSLKRQVQQFVGGALLMGVEGIALRHVFNSCKSQLMSFHDGRRFFWTVAIGRHNVIGQRSQL